MAYSKEQLEEIMKSLPPDMWHHSIDLGHGIITQGSKPSHYLDYEIECLALPDLHGKTVLDIGAWDGFYSFQAERRGAARVVALDHFVWAMPQGIDPELDAYYARRLLEGFPMEPRHETPFWSLTTLPGKRGFDIAHQALDSKVEAVVGDFMTMDLEPLGTFDVVFFLGVLYHIKHPLGALERLAMLTRDLAVIETAAMYFPEYEHRALYEFFESNELENDPTNWWVPNEKGLVNLCRAAGFRHVDIIRGYAHNGNAMQDISPTEIRCYRVTCHAWK